jgi:hypothetical protein
MKQFPFVTAIVLLACLVFVNAQAQSSNLSKVSEVLSLPNVVLVQSMGGWFKLEQGHTVAAGKRLQRYRCTDPFDLVS